MIVLKTSEDSMADRYVTAVAKNIIKTVDIYGFQYFYRREDGRQISTPYSTNPIKPVLTLRNLDRIEKYVLRNGTYNFILGNPVWDGGLKQYIKPDNTINPQWQNNQGGSITIRQIKNLKIVRLE